MLDMKSVLAFVIYVLLLHAYKTGIEHVVVIISDSFDEQYSTTSSATAVSFITILFIKLLLCMYL